jgi:hypothetical protein
VNLVKFFSVEIYATISDFFSKPTISYVSELSAVAGVRSQQSRAESRMRTIRTCQSALQRW